MQLDGVPTNNPSAEQKSSKKEAMDFEKKLCPEDKVPWDTKKWIKASAVINDENGKPVFEQDGIEAPEDWSQTAINVVAAKYFRGHVGTPERETSIRGLIDRVSKTITDWGVKDGYFKNVGSADAFYDDLTYALLHQMVSFNSPVWFNVGVKERPQASACFIQSVKDDMLSIMDLAKNEAMLFKGGSGTGSNLSKLRGSMEGLKGGGIASGPVSFMKGFDSFAGVIKSGGATRRAAKMVMLDADHPDILEFIRCKAEEEKKAHALIAQGYPADFNGPAYSSIHFQNANHSIRVSDDFMRAAAEGRTYSTIGRVSGKEIEELNAKDVLKEAAKAAWECGDPGVQFDTTINSWHTCKNTDRIYGSNPCCFVGETQIETNQGSVTFSSLHEVYKTVGKLPAVKSWNARLNKVEMKRISKVWVAGHTKDLLKVTTNLKDTYRCTEEHRWLLKEGKYVEAKDLKPGMVLQDTDNKGTVKVDSVDKLLLPREVPVYDMEVEGTHCFALCTRTSNNIVVHNSEYMFLDESACNLASINLLKFRGHDGSFETERFQNLVRVMITAMEILVGNSSYPTPEITVNSYKFRPLGLGFSNLGAYLMCNGTPYDSDGGRTFAGSVTSLMCATAYKTSAELAAAMGPFEGWKDNREPFLAVLRKHQKCAGGISDSSSGVPLTAKETWDETLELAEKNGVRNAQATVLAPTGTISFMMDCATTGIEPDIALIKYKKLVGGGTLRLVNSNVCTALASMGYGKDAITGIVKYIDENETIEGAPGLKEEHLPVFDCAFRASKGTRSISPMGHVKMMEACQPFLSGAISKTINMPNSATADDIFDIYTEAWRRGLKAVAVYRDGCKQSQPLSTGKEDKKADGPKPDRRVLPSERQSITHKFCIGGQSGYITVGLYEDGKPGEIFLSMAKEGSTISGLMDSFAVSVSLGLQYGVPLEVLVRRFSHTRFEPSGITNNPDVRIAKSIIDYIFRWLGNKFLQDDRPTETVTEVVTEKGSGGLTGPPCPDCGTITVRAGACHTCPSCGSTTGCG